MHHEQSKPRPAFSAAHHHAPIVIPSELSSADSKRPLPLPPRIAEECLSYLQFIELPVLCRVSHGFAAEVRRYFNNLSHLSSQGSTLLADMSLSDVKFALAFIKAHTRSLRTIRLQGNFLKRLICDVWLSEVITANRETLREVDVGKRSWTHAMLDAIKSCPTIEVYPVNASESQIDPFSLIRSCKWPKLRALVLDVGKNSARFCSVIEGKGAVRFCGAEPHKIARRIAAGVVLSAQRGQRH